MIKPVLKTTALVVLSSTILSACATDALMSSRARSYSETVTILKDEVYALGKPTQAIAHFPHALALAGKQNDYLITSAENDPAIVEKLFTTFDTKSLLLFGHSDRPLKVIDKDWFDADSTHWRTEFKMDSNIQRKKQANQRFEQSGVDSAVRVIFAKQANKVTKQEQANLQKYGFQCVSDRLTIVSHAYHTPDKYVDDPTVYTVCARPTKIHLTAVKKTINNAQLTHKLNRPRVIEVTYQTKHSRGVAGNLANVGLIAMLPVALAFDIATLPVQAVVCLGGC